MCVCAQAVCKPSYESRQLASAHGSSDESFPGDLELHPEWWTPALDFFPYKVHFSNISLIAGLGLCVCLFTSSPFLL